MSEELKPCPFCGSNDVEMVVLDVVWHFVGCKNLKCCTDGPKVVADKTEAIRLWNTRAEPADKPDTDTPLI